MTRSRDIADTQENLGGPVTPFIAGKNKIINGDFGIWQRGTTFTGIGNSIYNTDRWYTETGGTATITRQAFTPGTAPVAGYEGQYFLQYATATTNGTHGIDQAIEDVRTFAGQTVTVSAWMKANAATTITVLLSQFFGSGGSGQVDAGSTTWTLGTSWQRYTWTVAVPSMSGKTIGTGSTAITLRILNLTNTSFTFQLWGAQVEAGSAATPFTLAGGGQPQAELALCQRYYETGNAYFGTRNPSIADNHPFGSLIGTSFKVTKRAAPTIALGTSTVVSCYTNSGNTLNIGVSEFEQRLLIAAGGAQTNMTIVQPWTASAEL